MVSVIVPNYNHAPYLKQRIDSILNQTYTDFELIILDDCSTDNSREVIESYRNNPKVTKIVYNEVNGGTPFKQWDKGIELAQGEWIWIAESDDWAEPEFLSVMMTEVAEYSTCGLAYSLARYVQDGTELWKVAETGEVIYHKGVDFIKNKLLYSNCVYNVSMTVFRKDLFQKIDTLKYESMKLCGDWFFYTLLAEQTDVLEIQTIYSNYRIHDANVSLSAERDGLSFLEGLKILDYIVEKYDVSPSKYAQNWGMWLYEYEKKYQFSTSIEKLILNIFKNNHKLILFYYRIYKFRHIWKTKRA